jgi:Meiotically up-regulated gene 113
VCKGASNSKTRGLDNAVSRIAARIAGGSRALYTMTRDERLKVRAHAKFLHENSVSIGQTATLLEDRDRRGFVYVVTNPAWPGFVKIGHAFDPEDRLSSFNTGDPHRAYKIEGTRYFEDRMTAEAGMHAKLAQYRASGEWFRLDAAVAFVYLQSYSDGVTA